MRPTRAQRLARPRLQIEADAAVASRRRGAGGSKGSAGWRGWGWRRSGRRSSDPMEARSPGQCGSKRRRGDLGPVSPWIPCSGHLHRATSAPCPLGSRAPAISTAGATPAPCSGHLHRLVELLLVLMKIFRYGAPTPMDEHEAKVGAGLMVFQQLGGVNALGFYTSYIFSSAGISGKLGTILIGIIQIPITLSGALLMDRSGRRALLLVSSSGTFVGCLLTGLSFYFKPIRDFEATWPQPPCLPRQEDWSAFVKFATGNI